MTVELSLRKRVSPRLWATIALACLALAASKPEAFCDDLLTITLTQESNNTILVSGSGDIDLTDLQYADSGVNFVEDYPSLGILEVGPTAEELVDAYAGLTGPNSYGTNPYLIRPLISGSGDEFGIGPGGVLVPEGYVSGAPLSGTSSFPGNFAFQGITPGTYTYTYGYGADAGQIIVVVPEPSTWAMMFLGIGAVGFCARRKLVAFRPAD
jgi:hypothetical protein